jgi:hypothetical protein
MAQSNLIKLAKQGDTIAIATLLNRALRQQNLTVRVHSSGSGLKILLEGKPVPEQQQAIALIRQGMLRLQPAHISSVQVFGRLAGATRPLWSETILLDQMDAVSDPVAHPSSKSSPLDAEERVDPDPVLQNQEVTHLPVSRIPVTAQALRPKAIGANGIGALLTGFVLAILLFTLGPLKTMFHGFLILVHEIGHAATHWLFGRPAIPSVNILFGGGITLTFGQSPILLALIYGAIACLMYLCRSYPRLQGVLVLFTLGYTFCLLTRTNTMLSTLMGHGMELVAIALCLYLATSGYYCRIPGDRAIYAMLGFFTLFSDVQFSWRLTHDADFRAWYEGGIGGMIDNDFVILANEYFGVNLSAIANLFLIACLLAPAIAFLVFRYESWCLRGIRQVLHKPN